MTDTNESNVATAVTAQSGILDEEQLAADLTYNGLLAAVKANLLKVSNETAAIFLVDVKEAKGHSLFTHYLNTFPESVRPQYNCRTCAQWLKLYGQQVLVNDGVLTAFAFVRDDTYTPDVNAVLETLAKTVESCVIVSQKPDNNADYSISSTSKFNHFSGKLHSSARHLEFKLSGADAKAKVNEWREAVRVVKEMLGSYSSGSVTTFVDLFTHGQFNHIPSFVGPAKAVASLHREYNASKHSYVKENLIWEALADKFTTLYHFKASSLGALLGYIQQGQLEFGISEFKKYTDGLNYKRPTELPTDREIELATKRVTEEGLEASFKRTFAKVEDVKWWLWKTPVVAEPVAQETTLFSGMKKKVDAVEPPARKKVNGGNISMLTFVNDVLPKADKVFLTFGPNSVNNFTQLVTATDPDAKSMIRWDKETYRNTVSQYIYHGGSTLGTWTDKIFDPIQVLGITTVPEYWEKPVLKYGVPEMHTIFILEDFKDNKNSTVALFPDDLRAEYRDLRRVVEEYSKTHALDEITGGSAAGLLLPNNNQPLRQTVGSFGVLVETNDGATVNYVLQSYL